MGEVISLTSRERRRKPFNHSFPLQVPPAFNARETHISLQASRDTAPYLFSMPTGSKLPPTQQNIANALLEGKAVGVRLNNPKPGDSITIVYTGMTTDYSGFKVMSEMYGFTRRGWQIINGSIGFNVSDGPAIETTYTS